ncbi:DegT/DnrJ/EryC1/StrS aminotransferase family protein [Candidatus Pelagibacter sp.]|nr:DegT/DnrJ/EryC1/StrS aminotransferase family protein [Candidatus Pelagibacter sp.]
MQKKSWPNFSKNLISKVSKILTSGEINYSYGPYGKKFEKEFSKFVGNEYSVAICNGTAALEVAIKSLQLPKNSEIIVSARSFFSSAACIVNTGHIPIFADVNLLTQNISLDDIKKKINKRTKAIICVHLAGLPCNMRDIKKLANKNKIKIIEDCAQAHGASIDNKQVGSFGDVSTWSFCNDKIISTLGEGGMISTNNKKIYDFCKIYINHGSVLNNKKNSEKFVYNKNFFGTNLRITEIQSVSGLEQLKNLKKIQIKREQMAKNYFHIISKYQNYIYSYFPSTNIKCSWYRFYFFMKTDIKNYQNIRFKIIKNLKKNNLKCFTGSCPEIYLEKSFKKLNNFKAIRLKNCKILGETSIALDVNHTLTNAKHKMNLLKLKIVLERIFQA